MAASEIFPMQEAIPTCKLPSKSDHYIKTLTCQRFTHPADYIKTMPINNHMNNQHTKKEPTIESQKEKDLRHTKKQSPTYHEKIKHQKKRETKLMKYHTKTEQIDMKIKTQLTF